MVCPPGVFGIICTMGGKRFEVIIEKKERVCVVVEAADEGLAHSVALEAERRGDVVSANEVSTHVVVCKCCD